jgi:N utilization substance protein A
VGVRGTRIKNIVDELGGERIDIVRWNESLQVLIPNALQPAEIEEVMLCHLLGRAVVLVRDDQLSLAIGRKGQNVRLATKLVGWDIEIRTAEELDGDIEKAVAAFTKIPGVEVELAERLVEQGILGYDDLSVMEVDSLVSTIEGLTEEMAEHLIQTAETFSEGGAQVASNEPAAEGEAEEELSEQSADELAEQPALESTESSGTVSSDD